MSDKKEVLFEDLQYFWMPSGVPCFIADSDNICDIVENMGFNIYYLLSNKKIIKEPSNIVPKNTTVVSNTGYNSYSLGAPTAPPQPTITYESCLFKVVNNFVGRVVEISTDELPNTFLSLEEACEYTMPAIPHVLVEKMDQFFRLVHVQHGTESIVLLTFDMNKTGSDGWGILVPDQTNTSVHCKYDADSIAEIKPEHVMIVGSVHSHPEMPAYASGTDHDDQADFDGLHITYGWQKTVNHGATQYHMELQMSGTAYTLKVQDVFEEYIIEKIPDPEVIEWSGKVKKVLPPLAGGTTPLVLAQDQYQQQTKITSSTTGTTHTIHTMDGADTARPSFESVKSWTDMTSNLEVNSIVIGEIEVRNSNFSVCPSCDFDLDMPDYISGSCGVCDIPIVSQSDGVLDISSKFEKYCASRKIDKNSVVPYLFGSTEDNEQYLMKMNFSYTLSPHLTTTEYVCDKDSDFVYLASDQMPDDGTRTICCDIPIEDYINGCFCEPSILIEDLFTFEAYVEEAEMYAPNTLCSECVHYYTTLCPSYKNILIDFVKNNSIDILYNQNSISPCSSYENLYTTTLQEER